MSAPSYKPYGEDFFLPLMGLFFNGYLMQKKARESPVEKKLHHIQEVGKKERKTRLFVKIALLIYRLIKIYIVIDY